MQSQGVVGCWSATARSNSRDLHGPTASCIRSQSCRGAAYKHRAWNLPTRADERSPVDQTDPFPLAQRLHFAGAQVCGRVDKIRTTRNGTALGAKFETARNTAGMRNDRSAAMECGA